MGRAAGTIAGIRAEQDGFLLRVSCEAANVGLCLRLGVARPALRGLNRFAGSPGGLDRQHGNGSPFQGRRGTGLFSGNVGSRKIRSNFEIHWAIQPFSCYKKRMAYSISYIKASRPEAEERFNGNFSDAKIIGRNAVDSGEYDRVEIRDNQNKLVWHYPRALRPA
ncbi:hypothetical protein GRI38_05900 [Altererythrobacter aurantiacus]|uniref:Uncharacterized protein n=1 Tax=Parapontixanthobacter aurantiacus TaxID=1463599 RepID=A0A844ZIL6_9SPHN|nr:hypothetical protein [Parapontixanthobacter aurantiacus]MXO85559.1 hypothetical protein [Parapontixanthobacter aurantiacus]